MTSTTMKQNFTPKSEVPSNQTLPLNSLSYRALEAFLPDGQNSESQIPMGKGEIVEVIEKLDIGWWYVESEYGQGWVPASCLEDPTRRYEDETKVYATLGFPEGKPYVVTKCYQAAESDELSIRRGTIIIILEKKSNGWWFAEYEGVRGMVPGCFLARLNAAKGIRLIKKSEAVDSVNQSSTSNLQTKSITDLTKVNGTATEIPKPEPKPKPVPKPRNIETSHLPSPLSAPLPSPIPAHRPAHDSQHTVTKVESSMESSSDEEDVPSVQGRPKPPPPREASFKPTKPIPLPRKMAPKAEKKFFRACQNYESMALGTVSLKKGQNLQVMPRPENNGWMEIKVDGRKGFVPKECIEEAEKPPRETRDKQKCDLQDIEDAYWAEDAIEGESVLHGIGTGGTFMIRQSQSTENQETLLVYEEGKILKYKIREKQGRGYSLSKASPVFEFLEELIFYYSTNDLPKATTKLKVPYQRLINKY